jgi:hypothetical protein
MLAELFDSTTRVTRHFHVDSDAKVFERTLMMVIENGVYR